MSGTVVTIIIIGIVLILGVSVFALYNSLVKLRNQVDEGWAQINVQLKRRADLIPNLVDIVKGYARHEASVLASVTEARASVQRTLDANPTAQEAADANNILSSALGNLFAVAENYPDLKASQNFQQLQEQLTTTENQVAYARQYYNNSVRQMNTKIETVPTNIIAKFGNFPKKDYFEVDEAVVNEVPRVEF